VNKIAKGKFQVKSTPLPTDDISQKIGNMKMLFEKQFEGILEASSIVSMMGMMNMNTGSGGYVALERVTGTLDGRKGEFCLQHSSVMAQGKPSQHIVVIPDTATDELKGLKGEMTIDIVEGQHFYNFEYEIEQRS
jgi:Protein of unknown function (DUF3224)